MLSLLILAGPAWAGRDDHCEARWFGANLLRANAGICLETPLGQAIFGTDCDAGAALPPETAELIALYDSEHCSVDEAATELSLDLLDMRRRLGLHDVTSGEESFCEGWIAEGQDLMSGPGENARVVGRIEPGQDVYFGYGSYNDGIAEGPGEMVAVLEDGEVVAFGWMVHPEGQWCADLYG